MTDEQLQAVREHYAFMCHLNRTLERTDRLVLLACVVAVTVSALVTMSGGFFEIAGIITATAAGGLLGHTTAFRQIRRKQFEALKDAYTDAELHHMAASE